MVGDDDSRKKRALGPPGGPRASGSCQYATIKPEMATRECKTYPHISPSDGFSYGQHG